MKNKLLLIPLTAIILYVLWRGLLNFTSSILGIYSDMPSNLTEFGHYRRHLTIMQEAMNHPDLTFEEYIELAKKRLYFEDRIAEKMEKVLINMDKHNQMKK